MGMPLSYFPLLWALEDSSRPGYQRAVSVLSPFKLFAFVLLDLERDKQLAKSMSERWGRFDEETGRHLLFFAPVDPPSSWFERSDVQNRPHHSAIGDRLACEQGFYLPTTPDPSKTMHNLAKLLGVPASGAPILIVTSDLMGKTCWMLETNESSLKRQLPAIAQIANDLQDGAADIDKCETELCEISRLYNTTLARLSTVIQSIGSSILNICTAASLARGGYIMEEWRAKENLIKLQESTVKKLALAKDFPETGQEFEFECKLLSLSTQFDITCASLGAYTDYHRGIGPPPAGLMPMQFQLWTPESRMLIETGNRIAWFLEHFDIDDFRSATVNYGIAIESELSSCIGHEIRKQVNVQLPEFYNRYQDGLKRAVVLVDKNREISFNMKDKCGLGPLARWSAPCLGDLRLASEQEVVNIIAKKDDSWARLRDLFIESNQIRVKSAHPKGPVSKTESCRFLEILQEIDALPAWKRSLEYRAELGGYKR